MLYAMDSPEKLAGLIDGDRDALGGFRAALSRRPVAVAAFVDE
jgi:hypothetical protein